MSKNHHSIVCFLTGALIFWGAALFWKSIDPKSDSLLPLDTAQAQGPANQPISMEELETTSVPVTIPRPLEVPKVYAFERALNPQTTQVIIVESEKKRICVYHVDQEGIELVANRNYAWDLTLDDYNVKGLTPSQIKEYYENNRIGK